MRNDILKKFLPKTGPDPQLIQLGQFVGHSVVQKNIFVPEIFSRLYIEREAKFSLS